MLVVSLDWELSTDQLFKCTWPSAVSSVPVDGGGCDLPVWAEKLCTFLHHTLIFHTTRNGKQQATRRASVHTTVHSRALSMAPCQWPTPPFLHSCAQADQHQSPSASAQILRKSLAVEDHPSTLRNRSVQRQPVLARSVPSRHAVHRRHGRGHMYARVCQVREFIWWTNFVAKDYHYPSRGCPVRAFSQAFAAAFEPPDAMPCSRQTCSEVANSVHAGQTCP